MMSQDTAASAADPQNGNGDALENLLHENRKFAPTAEFAANADRNGIEIFSCQSPRAAARHASDS